jgi:histidine triad (HIT) family protein
MISDVFCKIIKKEIPTEFIYEDEHFVVFNDINPQAPVHVLIVPKKHIDFIHDVSHDDLDILGEMLVVAGKVARLLKVDGRGYRLILNQGQHAGQLVPHLHLHLLAGKRLGPKIVQ